ncbi:15125_t:CDS:2, partial [Dentiscutata erythropus]
MKMLRGRWRSQNNTWRLRKNGNAKRESRRVRKNTEMAKKKKERVAAVNFLIKGGDEYINRYPIQQVLKILKISDYHSEEWEETDKEYEYEEKLFEGDYEREYEEATFARSSISNRSVTFTNANATKTTSFYVKDKWWRSNALKKLLHERIDPTVERNRKPPRRNGQEQKSRIKSTQILGKTESEIPSEAPLWTLNMEALQMNNWENH